MENFNLKNFNKYNKELKHLCRALKIKYVCNAKIESSCFISYTRTIKIEYDLDNQEHIAQFLHELGHGISDLRISRAYNLQLCHDYFAHYNDRATKRQHKRVYNWEKEAWKVGRRLGVALNIPLGKWFNSLEKISLASYIL